MEACRDTCQSNGVKVSLVPDFVTKMLNTEIPFQNSKVQLSVCYKNEARANKKSIDELPDTLKD